MSELIADRRRDSLVCAWWKTLRYALLYRTFCSIGLFGGSFQNHCSNVIPHDVCVGLSERVPATFQQSLHHLNERKYFLAVILLDRTLPSCVTLIVNTTQLEVSPCCGIFSSLANHSAAPAKPHEAKNFLQDEHFIYYNDYLLSLGTNSSAYCIPRTGEEMFPAVLCLAIIVQNFLRLWFYYLKVEKSDILFFFSMRTTAGINSHPKGPVCQLVIDGSKHRLHTFRVHLQGTEHYEN